jgi:hypothetical protein
MATALFAFHNWIKSTLYDTYVHHGQVVVEIGSGRGGDLLKLHHRAPALVVNIDASEAHTRTAQQRYASVFMRGAGRPPFTPLEGGVEEGEKVTEDAKHGTARHPVVRWHVGDLTKAETMAEVVKLQLLPARTECVHVFSAQFSLTYFWGSASVFMQLLDWVAAYLVPGGFFIGTMPDGGFIAEQLARSSDGQRIQSSVLTLEQNAPDSKAPTSGTAGSQPTAGGSQGGAPPPCFGREVRFALAGSILGEQGVVEYAIDWPMFVACAAKCDLVLLESKPFATWYTQYHKSDLSADELQASFLNRSFVFVKKGTRSDDG